MNKFPRSSLPHFLVTVVLVASVILWPASSLWAQDSTATTDSEASRLETIYVTEQGDGSTDIGFKPDITRTVGPFRSVKILDTPYSINVMSNDLIKIMGIYDTDDFVRANPFIQMGNVTSDRLAPTPVIRGFGQGHGASSLLDGAQIFPMSMNMDDKERVEILTGLSGMLYGPNRVGGTQNFVLKRPTEVRMMKWTMGLRTRGGYFGHLDMGGPIDAEGKYGYRLNLSGRDGEAAPKTQDIKDYTVSAAFDWRVTESLLLRFNAAKYYYLVHNPRLGWSWRNVRQADYSKTPPLDDTFGTRGRTGVETVNYGLLADWRAAKWLTVRGAFQHYRSDQLSREYPAGVIEPDGSYTTSVTSAGRNAQEYDSAYIYTDILFDTGPLKHALTLGVSGANQTHYSSSWEGNWPNGGYGPWIKDASKTTNLNYQIGDVIDITDQWQIMAGVSHVRINTGTGAARIEGRDTTPAISLLFKPIPALSLYATYMESLENPTLITSTTTNYVNEGDVLPPTKSEQYEFGAKAEVGGVLLTLALFQIEKASTLDVDLGGGWYRRTQDGLQRNRGLEFSVTGKPLDRLSLYGGATFIDPKIIRSATKSLINTTPAGIAKTMVKMFAKYDLPFIDGLSVNAGAYYTGKIMVTPGSGRGGAAAPPTHKIPAVTLFDVGSTYDTVIRGLPVHFNLRLQNVFNKDYWIGPSSVGSPFSAQLSMAIDFM
ncbi:MAG: TonB-dependent receptor [Deltaproteobacteria bacterium]|jgi:iron complex outermembrane receptor protein|nr:TonB-dependent receptor [Deltaproteobacteria bacterium]